MTTATATQRPAQHAFGITLAVAAGCVASLYAVFPWALIWALDYMGMADLSWLLAPHRLLCGICPPYQHWLAWQFTWFFDIQC